MEMYTTESFASGLAFSAWLPGTFQAGLLTYFSSGPQAVLTPRWLLTRNQRSLLEMPILLPPYLPSFLNHCYFLLFVLLYCSVTKSCPILWDPMDCSTPGFPLVHHLPEFAQTLVHWVGDAIQPSHPLSSPSPAFSLSQGVDSSHQVAKVSELQLQCQSLRWIFRVISFRIDWFDLAV